MSWEPLNLAHIGDRDPVKPTLGGLGFTYPGKRHVYSGPQESAKTLAAYVTALNVTREDGKVVLIDLEMGQWDARDRLRDLGATDTDLERLYYVEPETPASEETISALVELQPTLVVIDAAAGAYELQGLDDNKRADVERFAATWVRAFWLHEIATVLIDHVVKNADNRGKYAIGSERKVGSADVHLGFEAITPLSRGGTGLYKISTHKDRPGWLPRPRAANLELRSDPVTNAITWTVRPADDTTGTFRPTALMERVSRYLELQAEPVARTAVEDAVRGKNDYIRLAIDCLVREGYANENPGPRGARLLLSVQAFREDDLAPTSPRQETDDLAPTPPRAEPHNQAGFTTSPHLAPTSPLAPERDLAPDRGRLQGAPSGRGEVVTDKKSPKWGDEMYPVYLAEAVRDGHVTHREGQALLAWHRAVERAQEAPA